MKNILRGVAGVAVAAMFVCGCYNYKAPAAATLGDSYSERKRDAADEDGITFDAEVRE